MEDEKKCKDAVFPGGDQVTDDVLPDDDFDVGGAEDPEAVYHAEESKTAAESAAHKDPPSMDAPSSSVPYDPPAADADCLKQIDAKLEIITGNEQRISSEVREMHKLYHTEFAGRLKAMQDELEQYRKIDKGRVYDDILASIARIYSNNETLAEEIAEPKAKKSIRYMLLDIEDLLNTYGMIKQRSALGEKRNPRHCQVLSRIPTGEPVKHDTVAKSYNSCFYIGNRTIIKEIVDIYIYEGQAPIQETEEEQIIVAGDTPATE